MSMYVHFGSIFVTRFGTGKDLRITDCGELQKASWIADEKKLIAADPYYLSLSPKFLAGEGLAHGKEVSMDGGRYLCRLPVIEQQKDLSLSKDYALLHRWADSRSDHHVRFFACNPEAEYSIFAEEIYFEQSSTCDFIAHPIPPEDWNHSFSTIGFLPVLEPILSYTPSALVGQRVVLVMPGEILRGELAEYTDYDLLLKVPSGFDSSEKFGNWGQWAGQNLILLDRSAVLNLYPQR